MTSQNVLAQIVERNSYGSHTGTRLRTWVVAGWDFRDRLSFCMQQLVSSRVGKNNVIHIRPQPPTPKPQPNKSNKQGIIFQPTSLTCTLNTIRIHTNHILL